MEWLLIAAAVLVVVAATWYLRRRPAQRDRRDELPDGPLDRDRLDGPDARGAVNKNSWMLGGGGTGG
ncbi:hypothetical protein [Blastococcus xanthinilyticus]|uniref:Uncharacterized protein n=1 Tax=Blastococcus xanthinilyticus TaxID=1564164 RepID=A0A5S5CY35_9ACTN|nr:hypothetical protein [Blastococcus xanthinilyticus]TYP88004.1 hypothetical protein BD833_105179 [Blastococcus xanthinilyticus]